jgi:hypothetical protein
MLPATRRLTLVVITLLAAHAVLAWVALHATFVFVELAWRAVASRDDYRGLLAAHLSQFELLRAGQLALWLSTIALVAFVGWIGRAQGHLPILGATGFRYALPQAMRVSVRWWWGLLLAAVSLETVARGLAIRSGRSLDLGLAMQALVIGQLVTIAAAVVGVAVVLGIDARQDAASGRHAGRPERA